MQIQPKVKNENKSVTSVDSLTSILGYGIQADRDLKNGSKTDCAATEIHFKMSTVEGVIYRIAEQKYAVRRKN